MTDKQYIYAVARIRTKEIGLLNKQFMEQLLSCKTYEDALTALAEKNFGSSDNSGIDDIIKSERKKTWDLMRELVKDMSAFNTFLYENDFHNLKAAIKQVYKGEEFNNIYIENCTVNPELILKALKEQDFKSLPEYMQDCAKKAYEMQMHTGDSQLTDVIIDKSALEKIYESAEESKNELYMKYAELRLAFANINIAIRCSKIGKNADYMKRAMAECKSININNLIDAANEGEEATCEYLRTTVYEGIVSNIKKSSSAVEKYCDDQIIELIKPQRYNSFTIAPIAAYILARENEIKNVRIIMSGKKNNLKERSIRERLRELYV
jgi:V/A-type H+-transporting ATPase subunit C